MRNDGKVGRSSFGLILGAIFTVLISEKGFTQTAWPQDLKNPSLIIEPIPLPATYMTMGIAFIPDGRMLIATTANETVNGEIPPAENGSLVMVVSGVAGAWSGLVVKKISDMWKQPSGITVAEGKVYIAERDGFYQIQDIENPTNISANRTKIIAWPTPDDGLKWNNGEQWHQWVMTPVYSGGKFYGPYGGTTQPGGRSAAPPTSTYSGAFLSWSPSGAGGLTKVAGGLRQPNGMTATPSGQFFVTDNQGGWLPACTFSLIKPNKTYGYRQAPPHRANWAEGLSYEPPVAWLPDGPHQSASQPLYLERGPYAGDFLIGDVNSPGLSRVALDKVSDGNYNGGVFFLTGGFANAAINRLALHPTEEMVVAGTVLAQGDWPSGGTKPVYRIKFLPQNTTFEMREIHSRQGGLEIAFSQAIDPLTVVPTAFTLSQWHYNRTEAYGCCMDGLGANPVVSAVKISEDHKRIFLASTGATAALDRQLKIMVTGIKSHTGTSLFHGTAYFTHNYQSAMAFNATSVGMDMDRKQALDHALGQRIVTRLLDGKLHVKIQVPGSYSLLFNSLEGKSLVVKHGFGAQEFIFTSRMGRPGMHFIQVRTLRQNLVYPVVF